MYLRLWRKHCAEKKINHITNMYLRLWRKHCAEKKKRKNASKRAAESSLHNYVLRETAAVNQNTSQRTCNPCAVRPLGWQSLFQKKISLIVKLITLPSELLVAACFLNCVLALELHPLQFLNNFNGRQHNLHRLTTGWHEAFNSLQLAV